MAFNNKADQAAKLEASKIPGGGDLAALGGQSSGRPTVKNDCALNTMGQGKACPHVFQGGNLGTFMGQGSVGGKV